VKKSRRLLHGVFSDELRISLVRCYPQQKRTGVSWEVCLGFRWVDMGAWEREHIDGVCPLFNFTTFLRTFSHFFLLLTHISKSQFSADSLTFSNPSQHATPSSCKTTASNNSRPIRWILHLNSASHLPPIWGLRATLTFGEFFFFYIADFVAPQSFNDASFCRPPSLLVE